MVFDVVLSTNLDPLLDDALAAARLRRRDYLLFINGVVRAERLWLMLRSRSPRVKVIKLHGDLFHRFMAWTPPEMDSYLDDVAGTLANVLQGRDVLVVGYSLRDAAVRRLVLGLGGTVWYVNPSPPPLEVAEARNVRVLVGEHRTFESVFVALPAALGLGSVEAPAERGFVGGPVAPRTDPERRFVETTDDLMAAVVGLARSEHGPAEMTGFLLVEPRLIVTDGWAGNRERFGDSRITIVTSGGQRIAARIRPSASKHVFGAGRDRCT